MMQERIGILLTVCAPSGAGKTTLLSMLRNEFPDFAYSVSYTTREPRKGEVHGRDYYFVSPAEFTRLIEDDFFAEWAKVHDNFYGTPKQAVLEQTAAGRDMLFDIDVQGAEQIKLNLEQGVYVFIMPPSRQELEHRLKARETDSDEVIRKRMAAARAEIAKADMFDYIIVNDDLDRAYLQLKSVYTAETLRPALHLSALSNILGQWED